MVFADFNSRFHSRNVNEEGILGPHIFGKGSAFYTYAIWLRGFHFRFRMLPADEQAL